MLNEGDIKSTYSSVAKSKKMKREKCVCVCVQLLQVGIEIQLVLLCCVLRCYCWCLMSRLKWMRSTFSNSLTTYLLLFQNAVFICWMFMHEILGFGLEYTKIQFNKYFGIAWIFFLSVNINRKNRLSPLILSK